MRGVLRSGIVGGLVVVVAASAAGCGGGDDTGPGHRDGARFRVERGAALADQTPGDVRLTGLKDGAEVTVRARAVDRNGEPWTARVQKKADAHGSVKLTGDVPRLLGTMRPHGDGRAAKLRGSGKTFSYHPGPPGEQRAYKVRLDATGSGGRTLATRTLTRQWLAPGTKHRELTVAHDKVTGDLYLPRAREGADKAPVLVFGGSEGGNAGTYAAALLASRGHPAMSVCYFRCGKGSGRPHALDRIDLDYFTHAAKILRAQRGADAARLTVLGNSRGSEAAQLLGQRRPSVFHNVVAYAPSSKVIGPYPVGTAAWTDRGRPVPRGEIPLDAVRGEVLAVAGGNDKMWDSPGSARRLAARGARQVTYPDAGHHVNWFPYGQPGEEGGRDGRVARTSTADQGARADSWALVQRLLLSRR